MVLGNTEDRKSEAAITNPPAPNLLLLFGIKSSFRDVLPTRTRAAPRNSKWGAVGEGGCGGGGLGLKNDLLTYDFMRVNLYDSCTLGAPARDCRRP